MGRASLPASRCVRGPRARPGGSDRCVGQSFVALLPGSEARRNLPLWRVETRRPWPLGRPTRLSSPPSVLYGVIEASVVAYFFSRVLRAVSKCICFCGLKRPHRCQFVALGSISSPLVAFRTFRSAKIALPHPAAALRAAERERRRAARSQNERAPPQECADSPHRSQHARRRGAASRATRSATRCPTRPPLPSSRRQRASSGR